MPPRTHLTPRYPCRSAHAHTQPLRTAQRTTVAAPAAAVRACVQAFGMGLGNSVAGEWRAYRLTTRDRFANLVRSGGAEIRAQMGGPADVSVRVLDLNDGMYELHWCAPAPDAVLPPTRSHRGRQPLGLCQSAALAQPRSAQTFWPHRGRH